MRNTRRTTMFVAWVKNVYSLCLQSTKTRGYLSTPQLLTTNNHSSTRAQLPFFTHFIPTLQPAVYTAKNSQLTPINYHLYTLSTAPTIKKNKKK